MEYLRDHPEKIYKYRKELTPDDVTEIMQKVKFDRSLKDIRKEEIDRGMKTIDNIKKRVDTANNVYQTGKNTWNNIAEIHNALVDLDVIKGGNYLPRWGESKSDAQLKRYNKKFESLIRDDKTLKDMVEHPEKYTIEQHKKAAERMRAEEATKNKWDDRVGNKDKSSGKAKGVKSQKWKDNKDFRELVESDPEKAKEDYPELWDEFAKAVFN